MNSRHLKIFAAVGVSVATLLSSCGSDDAKKRPPSVSTENRNDFKGAAVGNSVAIDYVLKLGDGTVFDTTMPDVAGKSAKYDPKRTYSPLLVRLGAGEVPKGLEKSLVGMVQGEKKTVTVLPEDGYGTATSEVSMAKRLLEDSYEETYSTSKYRDSFQTVVTDTEFAAQGKPVPKVGETLSSGGVTSRVKKIESGLITLSVENRKNPFFGKKLAVWLSGTDEGNRVTIVELEGENVTVNVENSSSPFKGKKIEPGSSALIGGELHTIVKIDGGTVVLKKGHELAGKTLNYEVTLKEIKQ